MVDATHFTNESKALLTPLFRISLGILRSEADAQDAVQQGLMKAWMGKEKVHPEKFRAWVTRIVINECRNIQRHRMRIMPSDTIELNQKFESMDIDVMQAIMALEEKHRIPFLMKYLACYKEREIAEAMRLPLTTVKNRLNRARQLLRKELSDTEVSFE